MSDDKSKSTDREYVRPGILNRIAIRLGILGGAVNVFVECPNCKSLTEFGYAMCPRCRESIDPDYAVMSAIVVRHNTLAVDRANTIRTLEPGALFSFGVTIYSFIFGYPALFVLVTLMPLISLFQIGVWHYRFGRFPMGDATYRKARADVKSSLMLWAGLLALQVISLLYLIKVRHGFFS